MRKLAVLGASGHGKVVADAALAAGWAEVVFYDDRWPALQSVADWPVVGDSRLLLAQASSADGVIVGIGDCRVRSEKQALFVAAGVQLARIVHPRAWVSSRAVLGAGSVVMAGGIVNIGAVLGAGCIVNTGATVDHDCVLGVAVHVAPGANLSGQVTIGDCSWIGVGACVREGVRIGDGVMVGAGAVVVADVADGLTVVGSPARILERRETAHTNA
ncbi:MAG: acetyltransferase [Steroidobacteraceae bacterium]